MKNFSQFNEDAQAAALAAHQSRTAAGRQARSGTVGGKYHKPSKRPKTGIGKFLKDKIKQMRKPELRSKTQQQQKSSALTKKPESRSTTQQPVQKVNVRVQQDKKKALPASQPRLTPAEKQKRLSSSAQRKALPPARS